MDALRREFDAHLGEARLRSDRVRELENAVLLLVDAQKRARRDEESQYRRLEARLQGQGIAIAAAGLAVAVAELLVHFA